MNSITGFSVRSRSLLPVAAGLAAAQVIATFFVWQSNHHLLQAGGALRQAGWLPLPAGPAAAGLASFGAAFWGGLFFTLSIGAGLALSTWAALFVWQRLARGRRIVLCLSAIVWAALSVIVNLKGWALFPTLFVGIVPLATVLAACRPSRRDSAHSAGAHGWAPVATLILLTALWSTQFDRQMFTVIRDNLLLSNSFGSKINDFYYRYTLYAAQAFKAFEQQDLRTGRIQGDEDPVQMQQFVTLLARYDVLATPGLETVDLILKVSNGGVALSSPAGGALLQTATGEFKHDPYHWLQRFSRIHDRNAGFRRLTFIGLLLGFPILLYLVVYGAVRRGAALFLSASAATWAASFFCLLAGLLLFLPILGARPADLSPAELDKALAAETWGPRVAALRQIESAKIDIARYPQYRRLLSSPHVVERYWLARALGYSRDGESFKELLALIRDPHPNVACQAYYALGRRGRVEAIQPIRERMLQSDHWYTQWYAYRALRRLGWHQTPSTSNP